MRAAFWAAKLLNCEKWDCSWVILSLHSPCFGRERNTLSHRGRCRYGAVMGQSLNHQMSGSRLKFRHGWCSAGTPQSRNVPKLGHCQIQLRPPMVKTSQYPPVGAGRIKAIRFKTPLVKRRFRLGWWARYQPVPRGIGGGEYFQGVTTGRADKTVRLTRGRMELSPLVKCAALAGHLRGLHPGITRLAWPRFKQNPVRRGTRRGLSWRRPHGLGRFFRQ